MRSILILLILSFGLSAFAQNVFLKTIPKHYVVFIHGIGGNESSFGVMPAAIVKHMDERRPDVSHMAYIYSYPTGDSSLNTDDFAMSLGHYLESKIGPGLNSEDKISFVAHSQGGLVATIWYFHASLGNPKFTPKYVKNIDALITLGTPFWGSKIASLLSSQKIPEAIKNKINTQMNVGHSQLIEMSLGSRTNINFRRNVMQTRVGAFSEMFERIRPLNIAGIANISGILSRKTGGLSTAVEWMKPAVFGGDHFESDTMVSIPSARFDSIYSQDLRTDYKENSYDEQVQPIVTNYSPFLIVNSVHASPIAEDVYDLSFLPSKCMAIADCDHPTYFSVLNHLLGRPVKQFASGVPKNELSGISLTFRVDLDENVDAAKFPVKIELISVENPNEIQFVLEPKNEFMASFEFIHPTKRFIFEKFYSAHFKYLQKSGPIFEKARWQGLKAYFRISAFGHKPKIVQTLLRPTYSTFIEAKLSRKLPEMRATPGFEPKY